jgi:nucleotide-binding universal stress UspA family protein
MSVNTVLAAIDDSAAAHPVLATALSIAPLLDATVEALHVSADHGEGRTADAAARRMHVPLRHVVGDPLEEIRRLADDDAVVALVVGARARPAGRHPAGHLALAMADAIVKPVVMVPPEADPRTPMRRVLMAMKGTPGNALDLLRAIQLAAEADLEIVVVHVDDEQSIPSFSDQFQYDVEAYAKEFLARYCPGAPDARLVLRVGMPVEQILATADETSPDMLAIGWPQHAGEGRGEVAREIVNRSHVPVLLVAVTGRSGTLGPAPSH